MRIDVRVLLLLALVPACGGSPGSELADAGREPDSSVADAGSGPGDAGVDAFFADSGPLDAALDAALEADGSSGFGAVLGTCGMLSAASQNAVIELHYDLGTDAYDDPADRLRLTLGAQTILQEGTAGGSSGVSEALSFEVLARCDGVDLIQTETQVVYDTPTSKKADIVVQQGDLRIGVSVTRAVAYPVGTEYTLAAANTLITRKVSDLADAQLHAIEPWTLNVVAVMAYDQAHADRMVEAFQALPVPRPVLYLMVTDGDDGTIYFQ
jgi:hypothetical protein